MNSAFKLIGQSIFLAASILMILVVMLDIARAADYNDCLYQRMVTAASYTALDDAEQNGLSQAVIQNLEIDLATAVEMEKFVCLGN